MHLSFANETLEFRGLVRLDAVPPKTPVEWGDNVIFHVERPAGSGAFLLPWRHNHRGNRSIRPVAVPEAIQGGKGPGLLTSNSLVIYITNFLTHLA